MAPSMDATVSPSRWLTPTAESNSVAWRRRGAYWGIALLLSAAAAVVLVLVFRESALPPGGDPGNWSATSLAFLGRPYPSQLVPLAYPPLVFPLLGAAILLTGGPIAGVQLFAGALMVAFGASVAALAITLLRSRAVALAVVGFLLFDPAILAMFFWGAYPNLLGFCFQNLALVGLLRAGQGKTSSGAAQFWGFFALASLSHSLVGVTLGVTTALYLTFGLAMPLGSRPTLVASARQGTLEAPGLAARALVRSRGGRAGLVAFSALVGGYYGVTFLLRIPHPYYFASNPTGFRIISMSGAFQALVPNLVVQPALVLGILITLSLAAVIAYAVARDHRPAWLTSPALLLLAWPLAVALLFIGGYLDQIVTDYHRFGFFFVVPVALLAGYLLERTWVLHTPAPAPAEASSRDVPGRPARRWRIAPADRRPVTFAIVASGIFLIGLGSATAPALARDAQVFTRVGHDSNFLQAVNSIRDSGVHGGILTVAGADKWAAGLTGENSFAPYSSDAYLFYPSQQTDAQLAYFALSAHYAISNGLVAGMVRAVELNQSDGTPDYAVYVLGTPRETLRLAPADVRVLVRDDANGVSALENLSTAPNVALPPNLGDPMVISFREPTFDLTIDVQVLGGSPSIDVHLTASSAPGYSIEQVDAAVTPPLGASAIAWPSSFPGDFYWTLVGGLRSPLTFGNVTPSSGLLGATDYDAATGGPAALLGFGPGPNANGTSTVTGEVTFATPAATSYLSGTPEILAAPGIWQSLDIRFVLMRNESLGPSSYLSFTGEIPYLQAEYGLADLYSDPEWTVLEVPASFEVASTLLPSGG